MSLRAITWAFDQHDTSPTQRLLLLAMADTANAEHITYPKVATLEKKTGFGKSTIYRERTVLCDLQKMTRLDRDRYLLHVDGVPERESDSQGGKEIPRAGKALNKGTQMNPDAPADAGERADDDEPQKLYDAYLVRVKGTQAGETVPPSLRRVAEKALREFPLDDLSGPAIEGFLAWRRKKPGDTRFSSIFATHPGGRPLHDHIAFWISNAADGSGLDGLPSEARTRIVRAVREVQRGHRSQDPDAVQQAQQAMEFLRSKGIEPVLAENGYPTFPSLRRGS